MRVSALLWRGLFTHMPQRKEVKEIRERYERIRKLGSGATAEVYLVWDSLLDREAAVKTGQDKALLLQEARYLTAFQARFFPAVYEYGEEKNRGFLIMEYVQGENLKERRNRILRYTEEEVFRIAQGVAEALAYLHTGAHACVYGDIKAENIMVQPDGTVKLVDFGSLAPLSGYAFRRMREGVKEEEKIMRRGGTFSYVPPEQWRGKPDRRSDIYALGKLLEALLKGNGEEISPRAEKLLAGCLQEEADNRYPSAGEFLFALESYFCDKF